MFKIVQNQPISTDFEQIRKVVSSLQKLQKTMIFRQKLYIFIFHFYVDFVENQAEKSKVIVYKNTWFLPKFEPFHKYPSIILAIIFVSKVVHSFRGSSDHFGEWSF